MLAGTWGWCDSLFPVSVDLCLLSVLSDHARACWPGHGAGVVPYFLFLLTCIFRSFYLIMPGRVSRDMGLVCFLISYFY